MTIGNPEQFKFKILTTGQDEVDKRKPCVLNPLNLEKLLKWIDAQNLDEATKNELKKSASGYPHQALGTWRKNYSRHVANAQAKLKKLPKTKPVRPELGEEPTEKLDEKSHKKDFGSIKSYLDNEFDEFENPGEDQG